ncbi:MerR family transcriptional regulator [Streptomyces sp. NPDC059740]|uniref:MerR family transcriptional regulator n=1 Tax=Streptomyces sp. NPDC059740 TaxID=3346926 RepID=UPI00365AC87B
MEPHRGPAGGRTYSVGEVAARAHVTVRTLHHYDGIGLLVPGARNTAGHRRYRDADLDRLQRILFYRELGFPLGEVAALLDDPDADPHAHLRRRHALLTDRVARLQKMAEAVAHAMEAHRMGIDLTPQERFEVFGDADPEVHEEEVRRRWGTTDAYRESRRRTAGYGKEDWRRAVDGMTEIHHALAELLAAGVPARSGAAADLAERHRRHICDHYYTCSPQTHRDLGRTYVSDPRFTAVYEAIAPGLAAYVCEAIAANTARQEGDGEG